MHIFHLKVDDPPIHLPQATLTPKFHSIERQQQPGRRERHQAVAFEVGIDTTVLLEGVAVRTEPPRYTF